MKKIIVIGGGAAGLMAGVRAAQLGASVRIIEKMKMVGLKMGITGKGRCNVTNAAPIEDFIKQTPGNGKFLYSAYQQWTNEDVIQMLHSWNVPTKVERGGRVFPESDKALDVRNAFIDTYRKLGGTLHLEESVTDLIVQDGHIQGVVTNKGKYTCDAAIIATGGMSYPLTGSSGDGYELAKTVGHSIVELRPSLIPLETKESWVKDIMGLSLKNVEVSIIAKNKVQTKQFGEMLFAHFGVTGPIVLSASHTVTKLLKKKVESIEISINLKPALTREVLDKRVQRDFSEAQNKQLVNVLKGLLPTKLIPVICQLAKIEGTKAIHDITKEERLRLVDTMQDMRLSVHRPRPIAEAIVTAGGISVKEVDPKTMQSKLVQGLYMAGEVLDIDAFTGGYNLQAAFSTAYVAATHAAEGDIA
ncbi:NAD(P)/FAD-dependent oxidoreductase [Veillonella sp. CHU740]|uniref:NAD(P)/FAD-dependent oxidoreductase n=1 Tax=Veillonella sp. CHU740 TaxID=2490950 RepID=UPI000F8ED7D4|nr:NAD(P)/FAD-dependent oxidoreductase [Veillonella sp. CHU740]